MSEIKYNNILEVNDLYTSFNIPAGEVRSVNGVSFALKKGKVLGIVGESGSGKSVTAYSIMQILQHPGRIVSGSIKFKGKELIGLPDSQLQKIRGDKIAIIFQDPMSSLNPVFTIGNQIMEAIKLHKNPQTYKDFDTAIAGAKRLLKIAINENKKNPSKENKAKVQECKDRLKHARYVKEHYPHDRAIEMLKLVGINEPEKRLKQYPFEFSGGMLQRIMIAMSLVCEPDLLIADEPTTALDVTIQAQILELLKDIQKKMGMAIIIITHDLGVVAQICDEIDVMYAGRIVERGTAEEIFYSPKHEYTKGLIKSIPQADDNDEKLIPIEGNPVDVFCLPKGCSFAPRCANCMKICLKKYPVRVAITEHHATSCFKYIVEAYEAHELTKDQFLKIIERSNEGTASFKPVSKMDILDALADFDIAAKKYNEAKNRKDITIEELEKLEFKVKETKNNYKRSKSDYRIAEKNRKNSRKDKPATERGDMAKKIKDAKKIIRNYKDEKVDKKSLYEYISNLSITSFPVDLYYNNKQVLIAKEKYNEAKRKLKTVGKDPIEKTDVLCEIDTTKRAYEDAQDKLARAKRVNKRLMRTRRALININTRRVKRVINNNVNYATMLFKENELIYTKKQLDDYLANFEYANWDLDREANKDDSKELEMQLSAYREKMKDIRKHDSELIRKTLKETTDLLCKYLYNKGDISIRRHYLKKKKYLINKLNKINEYNIKHYKAKGGVNNG